MFTKKIVAGAALLALAAAAQAQVKVYGSLDLSVGSYKAAGSKATTQVSSGNMMTSFIGFAGSEDLGGGLKAEFVLESFIAPDSGGTLTNNANGFWGRGSNIALSGGFGKVALGQYDNALFTYGYTYNPFGSSMFFSPTMRHYYGLGLGNNVRAAGGTNYAPLTTTTALSTSELRIDTGSVNSVTYESPTFGGFAFNAQFAPKESSAAGADDTYVIGASYNAGAFSAAVAYADVGVSSASNSTYGPAQKVTSLGASYDFGVVKAFGQYTDVDNSAASGVADAQIYQLGASIPVTEKGTVLASWGQDKVKNNGGKDTIFSLGYDHYISKRTDVYAVISNEKATGLKSGNTFAVGIKHAF
jgi:predicted porin